VTSRDFGPPCLEALGYECVSRTRHHLVAIGTLDALHITIVRKKSAKPEGGKPAQ